jgi:tetratricopeptide (TPR) repeat protein
MMDNVIQQQVQKAYKLHMEGKLNEAEMLYNSVLNLEMQNSRLLYALANLYAQRGFHGLSVNLLTNSLDIEPEFQPAWIDLGVSLKKENKDDLALKAWEHAENLGEHYEIDANKATLYADSGQPEKALELCNKAIEKLEKATEKGIDHVIASAHWNKALALLSLGRWKEGWSEHHYRRQLTHVWHERTKIDAPRWNGENVDSLYLHGEQGKGDEIMYLSMLKDVLPRAKQIVIELNDAVAPLVRMLEIPTVTVVTTQDEALNLIPKFDAKAALGDLGNLFRNEAKDFDGKPYLKADPERVEYYRGELEKLGPGPYVGISWLGGTKTTRVHKRTVSLGKWKKLLEGVTAVSLQYGDFCEAEAIKYGIPVLGEASNGSDLSEQAALIEACDYVITVAQTVVHLAGALGKKTYVLVCDSPSWRYGVHTDKMPWYESVKLIRQETGEQWESVIDRIADMIGEAKCQKELASVVA